MWCPGQNKRIAPLATQGLTVVIPEKDYVKAAMGLPLITYAVFLIAKSFW
jgi:hypothetical protein